MPSSFGTVERRLLGALVVLVVVAAGAAATLLGDETERPRAPSGDAPEGAARFDASERRAIDGLRTRLMAEPAPLPSEAVPGRTNAEVLTYIALTSEDPAVIAAALRETLNAYSSRSSQKPAPDAALERALLKHLRSAEPTVLSAALTAARLPLMTAEPRDELTRAVVESAEPEQAPTRRAAALEALGLLRPDRRAAHVLAAFEQALSASEPYLISLGLLALSQSGPSLRGAPEDARARIAARVLELAGHGDPGVRGRSLAVLSEVEELVAPEPRFAASQQHLTDPHPYVRAQAADLAFRCREPMAIHALFALTLDLAFARYELRGFATLDGSPGNLVHVVPGRQRVAEAALFSMQALSQDLPGVSPLVLTLGGRPSAEALVLENQSIAERWYRAEAPRIPRVPVRSPAP